MKDILENIFGFLYTLSMGDHIFFIATFIIILAFIYVLYLIKRDEDMGSLYNKDDISYLENVKEKIEKEYKPVEIELTDYEKEQEENAIISYEELINNKDKYKVSYDKDYVSNTEEIDVKKINLNSDGIKEDTNTKIDVKLLNYDKEEAFLVALKQLQQNLSN